MPVSLPDTIVHDLDGCQRNFEALGALGAALTDDLQLAVPGAVAVTLGANTLVFTASQTSATLVVPHGLPRAPLSVQATAISNFMDIRVGAVDATNMSFIGSFFSGPVTGGVSFSWVAIG